MRAEEEWREIPGSEGRYAVSSWGRFKSYVLKGNIRGRIGGDGELKVPHFDESGYLKVSLRMPWEDRAQSRFLHILVALTFLGRRPIGMQVRHLDGDPSHCHLENLAYGTPTENSMDRVAHGTDNRGTKHANSRLTNDDVLEIRRLGGLSGANYSVIARQFGIDRSYAGQIIRRTRWSWL